MKQLQQYHISIWLPVKHRALYKLAYYCIAYNGIRRFTIKSLISHVVTRWRFWWQGDEINNDCLTCYCCSAQASIPLITWSL